MKILSTITEEIRVNVTTNCFNYMCSEADLISNDITCLVRIV